MYSSICKFLIAFGVIFYLSNTDRISLDKLSSLYDKPFLTISIVFILGVVIVPLAALRFNLILRQIQIVVSYKKIFLLTWIGNFFNSSLPGAVSGDLIKGYYLKKVNSNYNKTEILTVLLLDRIIGLCGLIFISVVGVVICVLINVQLPNSVILMTGLLSLCVVLFYLLISSGLTRYCFFQGILKFEIVKSKVDKFCIILDQFKGKYSNLITTFFLSVLIQFFVMLIFIGLSIEINNEIISFNQIKEISVIPIGFISVAIPISPSGIGIGHASFEALFQFVGRENGANVFNLFIILQIFTNLFGVIFYIFNKKALSANVEEEIKSKG